MGGTETGGAPATKQRKEIANTKYWQIMEYSGDIVLAKQIPFDKVLAGYIGRLSINHKKGYLSMTLSPYVNFYSGHDINLGVHDILLAEATGVVKSDDPRAVKKSLKLRIRDIGKKISIERLVEA